MIKKKITLFFFFFPPLFDRYEEDLEDGDSRRKRFDTNFRWIRSTMPGFFRSCPCSWSSRCATDPPEEDRDERICSSCRWYTWTISTQGEKVFRFDRIEMLSKLNAASIKLLQLFCAPSKLVGSLNFSLLKKKWWAARYESKGVDSSLN